MYKMEVYLVGGAVRDYYLKQAIKDKDWVVVGATPQQMLAQGYTQVGKDFPVFLHPNTKQEYALARHYPKNFSPNNTLIDDLKCRDLTINAMAQDQMGKLIDPFDGLNDLQQGILRHTYTDSFVDDPIRVLRTARFSARYGFEIAETTLDLMRSISQSTQFKQLTPERVWLELEKTLSTKQARRFFETLRYVGALEVLFPEIDQLFGVPQPKQHHPEIDTGEHVLMSLQQACQLTDSLLVRFAVLMHDLGKASTPPEQWPHHIAHEKRGVTLVRNFCQRFKIPKAYQKLAELTAQYHTHCHQIFSIRHPKKIYKLLKALDALRRPQHLQNFVLACEADAKGRTGFEHREYPQAQYLLEIQQGLMNLDLKPLLQQNLPQAQLVEAIMQQQLKTIKQQMSKNY